ncbi:LOW QUALITY PROTEIN: exportin-T-like [Gigantopelta aegis]|uniref:LOW QUALITY PROTEIN: exportin-T-like n=1 Tax=Gigantopelta aegis TaxID=1735272 RepID=UPI001B88DB98|nr:LOW QUALITY PROTEIN: exportin-T-like [Gigantopelta aegis]
MDDLALQGLSSSCGLGQTRAVEYFEQLKISPDGWKLCAQAFTSGVYHGDDHIEFFFLQVVEHYLKTSYPHSSNEDHSNIKTLVMACLQLEGSEVSSNKSFIRNKVAQIVSLAFIVDYPYRWSSFFSDVLSTLNLGPLAVDMYLRILLAIDEEVVDREIVHSPEESRRNTLIKDAMRDNCVSQLADSWHQIMTRYETSKPEITCLCLDVVGTFVSWIDISLIANDKFVSLLLRFLSMTLLRESACDCIHEIVSKGMDPVAKTTLVESFMSVLENSGILKPPEDEEGDFLAKLSKLMNGISLALLSAWQKLVRIGDEQNANITLNALEAKIPYILRFLGDEDDDVSGAVAIFAQEYINSLKQVSSLSQQQREIIEGLLITVVKKMKYDESYNFEQEGEDEAMFQDYRKQMKTIFNNLAQLDSQLIILTVHNFATQILPQWEAASIEDVEMAVTLLYMLGEAVPASHGQHFSGNLAKTSALQEMMRLLITSRVSSNGHMIIQLQFFETVVRYDKFFSCEPEHIPHVVMAFLDERGFRHRSPKVRSRTAYLFSRFVKGLKSHMQNYLEDILKQMQDLLVLNTPDNGYQQFLSDDDQLFMYETAGILITSSGLSSEKKQLLMRNLLAPIATKYEGLLGKFFQETNEQRQLAYARCITSAMALASRASKCFSSQQTMKQSGCIEVFTELLKLFLVALNAPAHRQMLHTGVRQYLHRMVVCLEKEILPFIPIILENLLKQPEVKELYDFIPLLNQLTMKFKSAITPFLSEIFMPFVSTIFQTLAIPSDERDQVAATEKKLLQRGYYQFLSTIISNDAIDVLKVQDVQNLNEVLMSVVQGAVECPDPTSQKTCFSILRKMIDIWGGTNNIMGFLDFMYKNVIPACFLAPLKPTFDLSDAQTTLVLGESAMCLKTILDKRGEEVIAYLQGEYLPTLNLPPQLTQEFCQAMKTDQKTFRNYMKTFFLKAKS